MHTIMLDVQITRRKRIMALVDEDGLDDYVSSRLTDVLEAAIEQGHKVVLLQTLDDKVYRLDLTELPQAILEMGKPDAPYPD